MTDVSMELRGFANRRISFNEISRKAQRAIIRRGFDRLMAVLVEGANDLRNEAITSMRNTPPTGKLYGGGGRSRPHRASSPGNPPRPDTGDLIRSIVMNERVFEIEIGSRITDPPYPKWLEEGTEKMAARPWLEPAKDKHEPRIKMKLRNALRDIAREGARG